MKKIILHGSTIGTNFGDCLLSKLFYEACLDAGTEPLFFDNKTAIKSYMFEFSQFYRAQLNYFKKCSKNDIKNCDGVVLIPGGYFGETTPGLKEAIVRFYRYIPFCNYALKHHKPISILGVGAGPITHKFLENPFRKVFDAAYSVSVRNQESIDFLRSIGVSREISLTSDAAQILTTADAGKLSDDLYNLIHQKCGERKILLLHCVVPKAEIEQIREKIVPGIKEFVLENDYAVIFTNDQCDVDRTPELQRLAAEIGEDRSYVYKYHDVQEMIDLINFVDCVVTPKLHVGIVSCALDKPVLSFPVNAEKIRRYYKQLGYSGHCVPIRDVQKAQVYEMLLKYHNEPCHIPESIRENAKKNFVMLIDFLQHL